MRNLLTLAAFGLAATTIPAGAVTLTNVAADFSTPVGGSDISYGNLDGKAGNEIFRWGTPATNSGSNSFTFTSAATPLDVALNTQFSLGTFSYNNQPTFGTSLTSLRLALATTISGSATPTNFLFGLGVTETPNVAPCPFASVTPCSDQVTISILNGTGSFLSGGTAYTLFIDGFRNSSGQFATNFLGQEGTTTSATVIGRFAAAAVPEPSTWALMLVGFGLIGATSRYRRRKTKVAFA